MKTFEPPLDELAGRRADRAAADRQDAGGRVRRPGAADPPDVGRAAARLREAGLAERPRLAGAGPARGRARAAPARVRHQAARLGEAAARPARSPRTRWSRRLGPEAWPAAAPRGLRRGDRPAAPPAPAAPPPARHRRHRPLLGRRDPLGGAPLALQEGLGAGRPRRSSACTPRCTCSATRSSTTRRRSATELPDKLPMPLRVHKREGEPCPRCGTTIEAVFFAEHQTNYCPQEQTGGRVLKDRRLSRLLK